MEKSDDSLLQPVAKRYPDHQWLLKAGLVTAVLTGFSRAIIQTWELFYNNWKENPLFSDLRATRELARKTLSDKIQTSGMSYKDISTEMTSIENKWSSAFNKRLLEKWASKAKVRGEELKVPGNASTRWAIIPNLKLFLAQYSPQRLP